MRKDSRTLVDIPNAPLRASVQVPNPVGADGALLRLGVFVMARLQRGLVTARFQGLRVTPLR